MTTKLCWNCEGDVDLASEACTYCGVDLGGATKEESQQAFEPAYKVVRPTGEPSIPEPAYRASGGAAVADEQWNEALNGAEGQKQMKSQVSEVKGWLAPLTMLLSGSVFFLFGFVLFLFSQDGVFTLRWNANFSVLYLVLAVPLLYYGWQALQKIEE